LIRRTAGAARDILQVVRCLSMRSQHNSALAMRLARSFWADYRLFGSNPKNAALSG
jgi:hypothetical protein